MSSKFLTVAATAVASALLLTGCDLPLKGGDGAPGESTEDSLSMAPAYDTGSYRAEPHSGWPEDSWEELGPITETTLIGGQTLLPYEVDESFTLGRAPQRQSKFGLFLQLLPKQIQEKVTGLEPSYLTGYSHMASNADSTARAENSVLRFVSPEAAEEAANLLHEAYLAEGGTDYSTDEHYPLENVTIPGNDKIRAVKDERGSVQRAFIPKDEYLLFTYTSNARMDTAGNPIELGPDAMDWMVEYAKNFADKQLPLIDLIPSHKTSEGYGKSDEWPAPDPDDILRYTVMKPEDEKAVGGVPMALNARQLAGQYVEVPEMLKMYDNAKVEAAATAETTLLRAANAANAGLIEATYKAIDANSGTLTALEPYDEPQNVPGTSCYSSAEDGRTHYFCYLRYENYFAQASVVEFDPLKSEITTSAAPDAEEKDPKTKLSQIMAAQYLILEQAPKK